VQPLPLRLFRSSEATAQVTRGADGEAAELGEKDLLIFEGGEPHSFEAGPDGLEFFDVAWTSKVLTIPEIKDALASAEGVGEPYQAPEDLDNNRHIKGSTMPPQEGDTCFRYAHNRGHSSLDHWDQNSTLPSWRAADHSHDSNEEFWYIVEGEGHVEHGGAPGVKGEPFPVGPGSLIGHPCAAFRARLCQPLTQLISNIVTSEADDGSTQGRLAPHARGV